MTLHYPDIYSGQAGMQFTGQPIAMVKATQGTGYKNPDYQAARGRAAGAQAAFGAYHFLSQGNASAQADFAFSVVGKGIVLMLDFEPTTGSNPTMSDACTFIDRYRALGGTVQLCYFPQWYWQQLGSPSMLPLISRNMVCVSSNYTTYSDTGPGWAAYGGFVPGVWQHSATASVNGFSPVDMNAYKGTTAQWVALASGQVTLGAQGPNAQMVQGLLNDRGASPQLAEDGIAGAGTLNAIINFQGQRGLNQDGIVGPATLAALQTDVDNTPGEDDDDMPNGQIPAGSKTGLPILKGSANRVALYADQTDPANPLIVRVAVYSESKGYSQITTVSLGDSKPHYVLFTEQQSGGAGDVSAISFTRQDADTTRTVGFGIYS